MDFETINNSENRSELTQDERAQIAVFQPSDDVVQEARAMLEDACKEVGLDAPDEAVVVQAAKIIGALGENRVPRDVNGNPHKLWLLAEGRINAGKDPSPIFGAALSPLIGREQSIAEASYPPKAEKEIDFGPLNEYVSLVEAAGIGRRLGYGNTPGDEYCNFTLPNGNGADLMMHPYGIPLQEGQVLLTLRNKMYAPLRNIIVSSPDEALRFIREHGATI